MSEKPVPVNRAPFSAWAITGLGALLTYIVYSPGLMPPDAQDQLRQAQTGHFVDWHPPVMAWIWSQINTIIPGPEGFFLLLIILYWAGFFLLLRYVSHTTVFRYCIMIILPFSPFLFNFAGTIWKDVFVFGCYLVALGILLNRTFRKPLSLLPTAVVVLLLLLGALARYNVILAAVPLIVLLIWPQPSEARPLASLIYRLAICTPVVLSVWAVSATLSDYAVFHAKKAEIENSLFIWDIVGISHSIGDNLLPGRWSRSEANQIINACYSSATVNTLTVGKCKFVYRRLKQNGKWRITLLLPMWIKIVADHPYLYAMMRIRFFRTLFWPNNIFVFDADDGLSAYNHHTNIFFHITKKMLWFCRSASIIHFIFTVGFWMVCSLALSLLFCKQVYRGKFEYYKGLLLALSASAYVWPLLVVGVAGDLRYAYWSIGATCIALVIAGTGGSYRSDGVGTNRLQRAHARLAYRSKLVGQPSRDVVRMSEFSIPT